MNITSNTNNSNQFNKRYEKPTSYVFNKIEYSGK